MSLSPQIQASIKRVQDAEAAVEREKIERQKIEFSEEYIELNKAEENIRLQKLLLLEGLPNSLPVLTKLKETLMALMQLEGRETAGPYRGKFREKKEVKTERVLEILNGDLEHFLKLAKITQIDLKALAKEEGGERGEALEDCIEVVKRELIDLEPITPDR